MAGNSAGVKKSWLSRARRGLSHPGNWNKAGGALQAAGVSTALIGAGTADPILWGVGGAAAAGGSAIRHFSRAVAQHRAIMKVGRGRIGTTGKRYTKYAKAYLAEMKEADMAMCSECKKKPTMKGSKMCADCAKMAGKKELAAEVEADEIRGEVRAALKPLFDANPGWWMRDLYDDYVVIDCDGQAMIAQWAEDANDNVTIQDQADWVPGRQEWIPDPMAATTKAKKPKLGSGARFAALANKVGSPALAAYIGRKKYGAARFAKLSAHGKKEITEKAGNSAGVRKSWLSRARRGASNFAARHPKVVKAAGLAARTAGAAALLYMGVRGGHRPQQRSIPSSSPYRAYDMGHGMTWQVKEGRLVRVKAGTSEGAKKGWAHRARGHVGAAIAKAGAEIKRRTDASAIQKYGKTTSQLGASIKKGVGKVDQAISSRRGGLLPSAYRTTKVVARNYVGGAKLLGGAAKRTALTAGRGAVLSARLGKNIIKAGAGAHARGLFGSARKEVGMVASYKDADNNDAFVLVAGGSYQDNDGEWIKREAYDRWIASLKQGEDGVLYRSNGEPLVYRWWHVGQPDEVNGSKGPGVDLGKINFVQRVDNLIVAAGKYDTKEIADVFAPISDQLGASLGFFHPASQPGREKTFSDIDGFEISGLPKTRASFPFTVTLS